MASEREYKPKTKRVVSFLGGDETEALPHRVTPTLAMSLGSIPYKVKMEFWKLSGHFSGCSSTPLKILITTLDKSSSVVNLRLVSK